MAVPRFYDAGEVVFREGDPGTPASSCAPARARSRQPPCDGRRSRWPSSASGTCSASSRCSEGSRARPPSRRSRTPAPWRCSPPTCAGCWPTQPDVAVKMLAVLATRVRAANEMAARQRFQTVAGRVASALLAQVEARQAEGGRGRRRGPDRGHPGGHRPARRLLAREREPLPRRARAGGLVTSTGARSSSMTPRRSTTSTERRSAARSGPRAMVELQLRRRGIEDERVLAAMAAVRGSASCPSSRRRAYRDGAVDIGEGQTISQPWIVAAMAALLELRARAGARGGHRLGLRAPRCSPASRARWSRSSATPTLADGPERCWGARLRMSRCGGATARGRARPRAVRGDLVTATAEERAPARAARPARDRRRARVPGAPRRRGAPRALPRTAREQAISPVRFVPLVAGEDDAE